MQSSNESDGPETGSPPPPPQPTASYPPRVCRICLETVLPTLQPSEFLQKPRVVYSSEDPELGRLLRPCQCKGSSRYVHEGCLQTWRHADPRYGRRNYWQCPTCGFQYRLQRLTWARWISSSATQIFITLAILFFTIFILGFVADPIIDFYLGPIDEIPIDIDIDIDDAKASWLEHIFKGMASLGLLSFFRVIFTMSPWWGARSLAGGRTGTNGRDRVRSLNWIVIIAGILTFLWTVYGTVRSWTKRSLERAGEHVMDVPLPDDDNDDPGPVPEPSPTSEPEPKPETPSHQSTTTSSFVSDRTTLSCRAPANDASISQCAKNDPRPS
ncbi:hypothetical protein N7532_007329 [Penicillium argentinense]|uniref:RING-CH-type domain-containing protein n=1 Tax=Penicillium argentinense TaxID=1131581 RepID=A0A9W9K6J9_9EURO|nr:uncharacterized protein N7532_007329 [Penicillium argentinense]KAJ5095038.1 hypothetical protein N7532_007329 [Penicillium argentinense]